MHVANELLGGSARDIGSSPTGFVANLAEETPAPFVANLPGEGITAEPACGMLPEEKDMVESAGGMLVMADCDMQNKLIHDFDNHKAEGVNSHDMNLADAVNQHPSGLSLVAKRLDECCKMTEVSSAADVALTGEPLSAEPLEEKMGGQAFPSILLWPAAPDNDIAALGGAGSEALPVVDACLLFDGQPALNDACFDTWEFGLEGDPAVNFADLKAMAAQKPGSGAGPALLASTDERPTEISGLCGLLNGNFYECCGVAGVDGKISRRDSIRKPPKLWRSAQSMESVDGASASRSSSKEGSYGGLIDEETLAALSKMGEVKGPSMGVSRAVARRMSSRLRSQSEDGAGVPTLDLISFDETDALAMLTKMGEGKGPAMGVSRALARGMTSRLRQDDMQDAPVPEPVSFVDADALAALTKMGEGKGPAMGISRALARQLSNSSKDRTEQIQDSPVMDPVGLVDADPLGLVDTDAIATLTKMGEGKGPAMGMSRALARRMTSSLRQVDMQDAPVPEPVRFVDADTLAALTKMGEGKGPAMGVSRAWARQLSTGSKERTEEISDAPVMDPVSFVDADALAALTKMGEGKGPAMGVSRALARQLSTGSKDRMEEVSDSPVIDPVGLVHTDALAALTKMGEGKGPAMGVSRALARKLTAKF